MLKITTIHDNGGPAILRLEGKLLEPWIGELQEACRRARGRTPQITLDVSGISFVDVPGSIVLRELGRRGIDIRGCSPLVTELLKEND
jgi:hypothetical protein